MNSRTKINKLIDCVSTCEADDYLNLLKELNFSVEDFSSFINFSDEKYIRNCVAKGENFELILLCWEKGQKAAIHGHDGNEGWIYVLEGEFEEKRYQFDKENNKLNLKHSIKISEKQICHTSTDKTEFHSIHNVNDGKSISLHLYKDPIKKCRVFCEDSQEMFQRNMKYDFKDEAVFL